MDAADVLEEAADAFESGRLKWIGGSLFISRYDGSPAGACLLGGLGLAAGYQSMELEDVVGRVAPNGSDRDKIQPLIDARMAVAKMVVERDPRMAFHIKPDGIHLWKWNDGVGADDGATKEDVIEVFKLAAKDLRNQA